MLEHAVLKLLAAKKLGSIQLPFGSEMHKKAGAR